jgi:hypothetical protein
MDDLFGIHRVILETDTATTREVGRQHLATYLRLPNYTNNLRRLGFTDDDLADTGSDRLVNIWWPGVMRTPSAAASRNTTTPALITYASRPSPMIGPLSLGRPGAA